MTMPGTSPRPPRCAFVTGPTAAGRVRWLEECVSAIRSDGPARPGAVLVVDSSVTAAKQIAKRLPGVEVQWLALPCLCCPWLTDLPRMARRAVEVHGAEWIVVEVPPLATPALLAEFDRVLRWPRELVVWLSREWAGARAADSLSPFQSGLLALATRIVEEPPSAAPPPDEPPAGLSLSQPP